MADDASHVLRARAGMRFYWRSEGFVLVTTTAGCAVIREKLGACSSRPFRPLAFVVSARPRRAGDLMVDIVYGKNLRLQVGPEGMRHMAIRAASDRTMVILEVRRLSGVGMRKLHAVTGHAEIGAVGRSQRKHRRENERGSDSRAHEDCCDRLARPVAPREYTWNAQACCPICGAGLGPYRVARRLRR